MGHSTPAADLATWASLLRETENPAGPPIPRLQKGTPERNGSVPAAPSRRIVMTGAVQLSTDADSPGHGQSPARGVFARLGQTVTAHPGKVAFGWLLVVAALMGISSVLGQPSPSSSVATQLPAGYESARAQAAIDRAFGAPSSDAAA